MTNGALRYDNEKDEWHLLPWDTLSYLVRHYMVGAKKYAPRNWEKGMDYSRCFNSLMRHLTKWWGGEDIDEETGSYHLIAVFWNAGALLTYKIRGIGKDDRPSKLVKNEDS